MQSLNISATYLLAHFFTLESKGQDFSLTVRSLRYLNSEFAVYIVQPEGIDGLLSAFSFRLFTVMIRKDGHRPKGGRWQAFFDHLRSKSEAGPRSEP